MNSIYLIILVAYFLYYAGNIVYDGFLKTEKELGKEDVQEYSIGDMPEKMDENVSNIEIDDVENINTPKSFHKREVVNSENIDEDNNEVDLDKWRESFEAERELENFENEILNQNIASEDKAEEPEEKSSGSSKLKPKKINIQKLMKDAETKIQMIANHDGYKTYKIAT
ncbi:MAG: hypothetical protein QM564_11985 [Bergeyella sp.]